MEQILRKRSVYVLCILGLTISQVGKAQLQNKVGSLISTDRTISRMTKEITPHQALLLASDENTVFFAPEPVKALPYLKNRPNIADVMTWEPNFAGISKSMEWGFTTGDLNFQRIGAPLRFGEYLIIWKRNKKGEWKMQFRAVAENYGKKNKVSELSFIEPDSAGFFKQRSQVRLDQRKDVVTSNDKLFSTVLRSKNELGFQEFYADDVRLVLPWNEPFQGKNAAIGFLLSQKMDVQTNWLFTDRAYSGEIACTYGNAHITQNQDVRKYFYLRVWQRQPDHQWRIILDFYTEQ